MAIIPALLGGDGAPQNPKRVPTSLLFDYAEYCLEIIFKTLVVDSDTLLIECEVGIGSSPHDSNTVPFRKAHALRDNP